MAHTSLFDAPFRARLESLTRTLQHTGASASDAVNEAYRALYRLVLQQAQTLAYGTFCSYSPGGPA